MSRDALVRWMHLSDLNFRAERSFSYDVALSRLIETIASGPLSDSQLDFIFCTGDVAYSGGAGEYEVAREFFHRLSEAAKVPIERIFTVPGNHDVDRQRLRRTFRLEIEDDESAQQFFESEEDLSVALRPLLNYQDFDRRVFGRLWSPKTPYTLRRCVLRRLTVVVLGFNTTWLASSDASTGRCIVGSSLLQRAFEDALEQDPDIVVALMHHPVTWLAPFERTRVQRLLSRHSDFVLHGHIHEHRGFDVGSAPGGIAFLGAGSWSRGGENRRSFLVVELDNDEVRVQPHLFVESAAGHWHPGRTKSAALKITRSLRRQDPHSHVAKRSSAMDLEGFAHAIQRQHGYFPAGGEILERHAPAIRIEDAYVAPRLQSQDISFAALKREELGETVDLDVLLKRNHRIVVLGEPGSGKTTLLKRYLLAAASELLSPSRESEVNGQLVPVYLPLRKLGDLACDDTNRESECTIYKSVNQLLEPFGATPIWVRSALGDGRLILLLDGLDELASQANREEAIRLIGDFAMRWPAVHIVITSRLACFHAARLDRPGELDSFVVCHLRPFSQEQIQFFIRTILATMIRDRESSERIEHAMLRSIGQNAYLAELATSPLMLWLIVLTSLNLGVLPKRADLYRSLVQTYVERWDRSRGIGSLSLFERMSAHHRLAFLKELALVVHQRGPNASDFMTSDVSNALAGVTPATSELEGEQRSLLGDLVERTGLVMRISVGSWRFVHVSIQEYLAACAILENQKRCEAFLGAHLADSWWREVVLFTLAEAQNRDSSFRDHIFRWLINHAESERDPCRQPDAFGLLASAAIDAIDMVDGSEWISRNRRLFNAAMRIIEDPLQPGSQWSRIQLARLLGKAGDPRLGWDDDKLLVAVPAGPFIMGGDDQAASEDEKPQHTVFVSTFLIGRFPVTNQQFIEFLEAGAYNHDNYWAGGFGRRTDIDSFVRSLRDVPNFPITEVSWFEAEAFCRWLNTAHPRGDGLRWRLPTEAEWEKAARGGMELGTGFANQVVGRRYPWGEDWSSERANAARVAEGATPVGLYPSGAGPYRTFDQAGNVGEWCQDGYWTYGETMRSDPLGMTSSAVRAVRGGDWTSSAREVRVSSRAWRAPAETHATIGFRLVASSAVPVPSRPPNPFRPGIALPSDAPPPGRMAVISELTSRILDGGSCTLLGPRRSGKTSILRYLRTVLAERHRVRFLDLQGYPCRTPDVLAAGLERSLERHPQPAKQFRRMLAAEPNPVLLLDELGRLQNADADADPNVFEWLRALGQEGVVLVLAGTDGDWDLAQAKDAEKPGSSFTNIMKPFRLGPLSPSEATAFLSDSAPNDAPIDPAREGAQMVELTGGWPFYLQVLGHAYVEERRAGRNGFGVRKEDILYLYEQALLRDYEFVFRQRWREMHKRTRAILLRAAPGRLPAPTSLSPSDIEHLESQGVFDVRHGWVIEQDQPFLDWMHAHRPGLQAKDEEDCE